jgi:hypothetical protein
VATLAEILDEMADTIRNVLDDVTDIAVQVEPRWVANPTFPCVDMYPGDPSTDLSIAAMGDVIADELINVRARIDVTDAEETQNVLLALMDDEDPLSVMLAVEDDQSPERTRDSSVDVRNRSGYVAFSADGSVIGCLWTVEVIKARS